MRKSKRVRFFEFLVIGVCIGLIEDLLAIMLATDATINWRVVLIALLVAVPFAYISEMVVDHPRFWENLLPGHWFQKDN